MRSSLEIYDLASGNARVVFQTEDLIEAPNWEPSGDTLVFNGGGLLYRIALDGGAPVQIDTGVATRCNNDHGVSPDGRTLVVSHRTEDGSTIFTLPAEGGTPQQITPGGSYWHGWSPDGSTLAFVGKRGGRFDIYTVPVSGGAEARLTGLDGAEDGHNDGPDYAADGMRIWFNSDRTGHAQIWTVGLDGSNPEQVTFDERVNWFPHPSPDGQWVVYLSYPPGTEGHPADLDVELRLMRPDGSDMQVLLAFNGGQGTINVPSWAPDSSGFAFVRYERP